MTLATLEAPTTDTSTEVMALGAFADAVEVRETLSIYGTAKEDSVFVLRDSSKEIGIEGAYVEVSVAEILKLTHDDRVMSLQDKVEEFVNVVTTERAPIVLQGVTRIVGYYSRVNNWNKSKIGELRDRQQSNYALSGQTPEYDVDRHKTIDNM